MLGAQSFIGIPGNPAPEPRSATEESTSFPTEDAECTEEFFIVLPGRAEFGNRWRAAKKDSPKWRVTISSGSRMAAVSYTHLGLAESPAAESKSSQSLGRGARILARAPPPPPALRRFPFGLQTHRPDWGSSRRPRLRSGFAARCSTQLSDQATTTPALALSLIHI